jgi:hypothetical protein
LLIEAFPPASFPSREGRNSLSVRWKDVSTKNRHFAAIRQSNSTLWPLCGRNGNCTLVLPENRNESNPTRSGSRVLRGLGRQESSILNPGD